MNDFPLPEPEDYRSAIANAIRQTRQLVKEALGYIKRQEDGPVTMRYALRDINKAVDDIQFEASYLTDELDRWRALATKAMEQRDEAVRQRDILLSYLTRTWKHRRRH